MLEQTHAASPDTDADDDEEDAIALAAAASCSSSSSRRPSPRCEHSLAEDRWVAFRVHGERVEVLGRVRRCPCSLLATLVGAHTAVPIRCNDDGEILVSSPSSTAAFRLLAAFVTGSGDPKLAFERWGPALLAEGPTQSILSAFRLDAEYFLASTTNDSDFADFSQALNDFALAQGVTRGDLLCPPGMTWAGHAGHRPNVAKLSPNRENFGPTSSTRTEPSSDASPLLPTPTSTANSRDGFPSFGLPGSSDQGPLLPLPGNAAAAAAVAVAAAAASAANQPGAPSAEAAAAGGGAPQLLHPPPGPGRQSHLSESPTSPPPRGGAASSSLFSAPQGPGPNPTYATYTPERGLWQPRRNSLGRAARAEADDLIPLPAPACMAAFERSAGSQAVPVGRNMTASSSSAEATGFDEVELENGPSRRPSVAGAAGNGTAIADAADVAAALGAAAGPGRPYVDEVAETAEEEGYRQQQQQQQQPQSPSPLPLGSYSPSPSLLGSPADGPGLIMPMANSPGSSTPGYSPAAASSSGLARHSPVSLAFGHLPLAPQFHAYRQHHQPFHNNTLPYPNRHDQERPPLQQHQIPSLPTQQQSQQQPEQHPNQQNQEQNQQQNQQDMQAAASPGPPPLPVQGGQGPTAGRWRLGLADRFLVFSPQ
mmetsp:Transcript_52488/g.114589  ORF Transcript_52488/g.114589 Transcript_52488/m.114589 type:complete len:652 (-) Transcript_52488:103-2058(-)